MEKIDTKKIVLGGVLLIIIVLGIFIYMNYLRTFTVTFEVRLGPGIETQQVKINDTVKRPEDPSYDGYEFVGWYVDDTEYNFDEPVTKNLTITAKWEEINDVN